MSEFEQDENLADYAQARRDVNPHHERGPHVDRVDPNRQSAWAMAGAPEKTSPWVGALVLFVVVVFVIGGIFGTWLYFFPPQEPAPQQSAPGVEPMRFSDM